jgi:hypothetical protein
MDEPGCDGRQRGARAGRGERMSHPPLSHSAVHFRLWLLRVGSTSVYLASALKWYGGLLLLAAGKGQVTESRPASMLAV